MVYDPSGYTGTRIPDILAAMERDQSWLARKMGVSPALVNHVLLGRRSITRSFVMRACAALNLPESAVFIAPSELLASTESDEPAHAVA
jgi:transcriptional regulator with XRE-family HTH domain